MTTQINDRNLEDRIRLISSAFKHLPDPTLLMDADFNIISLNNPFKDLFGYSIDEVLGKKPDLLNAENIPEETLTGIYETLAQGSVWRGVLPNKRKDGSKFLSDTTLSALSDNEGVVFAYLQTQKDVTIHETLVQDLKENGAILSAFIEEAIDFFYIVDKDLNLVYVNPSMNKALGYGDLVGKNLTSVFNEPMSQDAINSISAKLSRERHITIEHQWKTKAGICLDGEINLFTVHDSHGKLKSVNGVFHDITARKRILSEKSRLLEERTTLLAEVNHRVKNNLAIVYALLNREREQLPYEHQHLLDGALSRTRVIGLSHKQMYQSEDLNNIGMRHFMAKYVSHWQEMYANAHQSISISLDISEHAHMDLNNLIQYTLLINEVVTNSYKYAFEGRNSGKIAIEVIADELGVIEKILISDDGIGTTSAPSRIGLGTQLIADLSTQLGFNVKRESDSSKGTSYEFSFKRLNPNHNSSEYSNKSNSVYIVEDEFIVARDLEAYLSKKGYLVSKLFSSGEELIANLQISPTKPKAVIMDVNLGKDRLNGIETAVQIKNYDLPIIFCTGEAHMDKRLKDVGLDGTPIIMKPYDENELLKAIEAVVK